MIRSPASSEQEPDIKNVGLLPLPSGTFSPEQFAKRTIYRDVDEFTDKLAERLRSHLSRAGLECTAVGRCFKPYGSGFRASDASGGYLVTVSAEQEILPQANIVIFAQAGRRAAGSWPSFEPRLQLAVKLEFPDCDCHWMTVDEFIESDPST